ncbi:MAG: lysyl-tRNA synthetase, class [Baekduia sp.]|nr:lysyl-tRNA synthetase, class [Baekduia sp.]
MAGAATVAVGLVNVVSALLPTPRGHVHLLLAVASHAELAAARSIAFPLGLALIVAGVQLARGRRGAAQVAVGALAAMGAVDLAKGPDVIEATATWALALWVWRSRSAFPALTPRRVGVKAIVMLGVGACALAGAAVLPGFDGTTVAALVGAAVLWAGAARALVSAPAATDERDRRRAAAHVRRFGSDTLSAFKLRRDLQHRFHADGRSLVGQRTQAGALLVAGDPVGADEDLGAALAGALDEARAHGLSFGVVNASERCAEAGRALGLRSLYLGDEAMLATGPMDLSGGARKSLRKAVNRVARTYAAELHLAGDLDAATLAQLAVVWESWRDGAAERGFSMAGDAIADELLPDAVVVLARGDDGSVGGFLQFVPVFGRPQVSLGYMCREHDTPNGLTEFLVVRVAELLAERGIEEFSLNFAAFGRWLRAPANPLQRALAALLRVGDRWLQIERLERFNARFDPRWQPRYLLFDGVLAMPRIAAAALCVEGQIQLPAARPLRPAAAPAAPTAVAA